MEEKNREVRGIREENKRLAEKCRDHEIDNDKGKKEYNYLLQRSDGDVKKMQEYLGECEGTIGELRDKLRDMDR